LADGSEKVTSIGPGAVGVRFFTAGPSVVKIRWSPYWALPGTAARSSCLRRSAGGWTEVISAHPRVLRLTISLLSASHGNCSTLLGAEEAYDRGVNG
jgi:hypothetical protein